MITITRARARFFTAIAAGLAAGCHHDTAATVTVEPLPPTPQPRPIAAPSPSAHGVSAMGRSGALTCPEGSQRERFCVAPRTPPDTGGNVPAPGPYGGFDKDGCFEATAIVGACNGIRDAMGPVVAAGQCCFEVCRGTPAPCGRPLVVAGRARTAPVIARDDWSAAPLGLAGDDAHVRALAAQAWQLDAAAEHASVASFARLSLQLLALGAPSELVAAAHAAALEEIEHARVCFGIAAELSEGAALGPAPLSLEGVGLGASLEAVAREAAAQSCVGETVAALALARAAEWVGGKRSPLGSRLAKMAEEELSHAALGWQLVAWAWRTSDASSRDSLRAAIEDGLAAGDYEAPALSGAAAEAWRSAGRITAEEMASVEAHARTLVADARHQLFV